MASKNLYLIKYEMTLAVYGEDEGDAIMESFDYSIDYLPYATTTPVLITDPAQLPSDLKAKVPLNARNEKTCAQVAQRVKDDNEKHQMKLF